MYINWASWNNLLNIKNVSVLYSLWMYKIEYSYCNKCGQREGSN